jgi:hypothetical protein
MANDGQEFRALVTSGACTDTTDGAELSVINNIGAAEAALTEVKIYPNPATDVLTLYAPSTLTRQDFEVLNTLGQTVLSGEVNARHIQISIAHLPNGKYVLTVGGQYHLPFVIAR